MAECYGEKPERADESQTQKAQLEVSEPLDSLSISSNWEYTALWWPVIWTHFLGSIFQSLEQIRFYYPFKAVKRRRTAAAPGEVTRLLSYLHRPINVFKDNFSGIVNELL